MATPSEEYDVFISYRHVDSKDFVEKLGRHFRQNDIKFFRDEDQIKAGQEISEECKKAMDNSKVFLPIISKTYSDGVSNMEFYYNKKQARKPLVVVVMPGTTESNIPYNYEVQNVKQVRLKEEDMKEESLRKRLDEIVVGVMDKLKGETPGTMPFDRGEDEYDGPQATIEPADDPMTEPIFDEKVNAAQLVVINYDGKKLYIRNEIGTGWQDVARQLEFSEAEISGINAGESHQPQEACSKMMQQWMRRDTKATWRRLIKVLIDIQMGPLAGKIKLALRHQE